MIISITVIVNDFTWCVRFDYFFMDWVLLPTVFYLFFHVKIHGEVFAKAGKSYCGVISSYQTLKQFYLFTVFTFHNTVVTLKIIKVPA